MYTLLVVVQVISAMAVIGLVLLQHGKGADAGAAFGSGASGTVFGSRGSANFLTRATAASATIFFVASLSLAYVVQGRKTADSVVDRQVPAAAPTQAVVPEGEAPAATIPDDPMGAPAAASPDETPQVPE